MRSTRLSALLGVCLLAAVGAASAQPRIVNGSVTTRALTGGLAAEMSRIPGQHRGVVWIGYGVPANKAGQEACCQTYRGHTATGGCCGLEKDAEHVVRNGTDSGKARLEASSELAVFIRFESGTFGRAAAYSHDCEIDAGGTTVVWLTGVKPADSLAWLGTRVSAGGDDTKGRDGLLAAVAFHADGGADSLLERLALSSPSRKVQQSAVFWMGAARGATGFAGLKRALAQLTDAKLREQVVFAISISKEPGSLDLLLGTARNDSQSHVRGQALFWLAQKAGDRVADTIVGAITNDPDTDVKVRAVFALSQLPKDEGVPKLIGIARTHKILEVRKQAMFWLGQSKDPRALAFFEQVLTGK